MPEPTQIAVVGDATSVSGFRPLGFAVFPVEDPMQARELWAELAGGRYAIVLATEPVFAALGDLAAEIVDSAIPAVTVIPGAGSAGGVGQEKLDRAIERALGTTVFIREEDA